MISCRKQKFYQRPLTEWPGNVYYGVGILRQEPKELEERHGIVFTDTADDLDAMKAAVIVVPPNHWFVLQRYARSPKSGTPVLVDYTLKNKLAEFERFKAELGFSDRDFLEIDESVTHAMWPYRLKKFLHRFIRKSGGLSRLHL